MAAIDDQSHAMRSIGRLTVQSSPRWIRIVVPRIAKYWSILGTMLVVGSFLLLPDVRRLLPPHDPATWTFVGIYFVGLLLVLLWSSASRDVITIQPPTVAIRREIFHLGWTRHYPLDQLPNLQFRHRVSAGRQSVPSRLTFDYEYLPRACAFDITVEEAAQLIPLIQAQFPHLVERSSTSTAVAFDDPVQVGKK